jgi:hypothetical protein
LLIKIKNKDSTAAQLKDGRVCIHYSRDGVIVFISEVQSNLCSTTLRLHPIEVALPRKLPIRINESERAHAIASAIDGLSLVEREPSVRYYFYGSTDQQEMLSMHDKETPIFTSVGVRYCAYLGAKTLNL